MIDPATPTASITNSPVTYNGSAQTATVACLGGGAATLASGGTGTNAGSYPATVDCAASTNYSAATGLSAGNFVIDPATPTASITNSPVTYNGSAQTATVACLGGGAATLASGGTGTNAGSYPATVDCAASTNYCCRDRTFPGDFVIDPATPTASITNSPVDLQRLGADRDGSLPGRRHGHPGQRRHGHQCRLVSGHGRLRGEHQLLLPRPRLFRRQLRDDQPGQFDNDRHGWHVHLQRLAHAATVSVTGAGGLSLSPSASYSGGCSAAPVNVSETTPTACTASYTYVGDANHTGSNGSDTIVINPASSTTTLVSSANPSVVGSSRHLHRDSGSTATGTVQFYADGVTLDGTVALSGGTRVSAPPRSRWARTSSRRRTAAISTTPAAPERSRLIR